MSAGEEPRHYWTGTPDAELIRARDEYRAFAVSDDKDASLKVDLGRVADDIDDDLQRRAVKRAKDAAQKQALLGVVHPQTGTLPSDPHDPDHQAWLDDQTGRADDHEDRR